MNYSIPSQTTRTEIIIQKSRFIATATRADTIEQAKSFIDTIRSEMPNASHHVYAFRIGYGNSVIEGMSDDGEPSGTSGPPILAILRGTDIGDIVIVVTRYFGGTKLGTGGLVRAYSDAARSVLDLLPIEIKISRQRLLLDVSYSHYESVKQIIQSHDTKIETEEFTSSVLLEILLPVELLDNFRAQILDVTAGQSDPLIID